jgi:hypothetical protein
LEPAGMAAVMRRRLVAASMAACGAYRSRRRWRPVASFLLSLPSRTRARACGVNAVNPATGCIYIRVFICYYPFYLLLKNLNSTTRWATLVCSRTCLLRSFLPRNLVSTFCRRSHWNLWVGYII